MLKHIHMTFALLSVLLFSARFVLLLMRSEKLQLKWLKILPHIVDTLLLVFGIALAVQLSINPVQQLWFAEKLLAVLAYIITGYYTLKMAKTRGLQILGYIATMGWVMLIVHLAVTKTALF